MKAVKFNDEKNFINDFLLLSKKLYGDVYREDEKTTASLLTGKHPLCKYFSVDKFLIYSSDNVAGRFVITTYPGDNTAYIGFYECEDDDEIAKFLFQIAFDFVEKKGADKIVGPVDCSFWIKYRLKTNMFDSKPYTGEPYNLSYYKRQFEQNGFKTMMHYTSNVYNNIGEDYKNDKFTAHYEQFYSLGYKIENADMKKIDKSLDDVYRLLTTLYSPFPTYKDISLEDFRSMFSSFKRAVDPKMVKFAYYNGEMVGFLISVPDYGSLTNNLNLKKLFQIMKIKKNPKRYVILYMGVDKKHKGLGKALAFCALKTLQEIGAQAIGALTMDGKVTQNYADDLMDEKRYEYILFERSI